MTNSSGLTREDLDGILTWNLVRVTRFAAQRLAQRLASHHLNPVHFGVLAVLAIEGEMTQADLARAVLLRPQSIAPLLDGLEQRELIRRTGSRARGRRNPVDITAQGREQLDAVWGIAFGANSLTDAGLSFEEGKQLNSLLLKVAHAIQRQPEQVATTDAPASGWG